MISQNPDDNKAYGNYYFTKMISAEDYAFTIQIGDNHLKDIRFADFTKLMAEWTVKTKPIVYDLVTIEMTDTTDVYKLTFNGQELYLAVYADKGIMRVFGGNNYSITNVIVSPKN